MEKGGDVKGVFDRLARGIKSQDPTRTTAATVTWEANFSVARRARKRSIFSVQNLRSTQKTFPMKRGTALDAGRER